MARGRLPVVVSVPHGGVDAPAWLGDACLLGPDEFASDGDTWAREIYDVADRVQALVETTVPRAVVDMNRPRDDMRPDGVVKTVTVDGRPVWRGGGLPAEPIVDRLLAECWDPYHERLARACRDPGAVLGVDCHTMLAVGPAGGPLDGLERPPACVSNLGGPAGEPAGGPVSAPAEVVVALREALEEALGTETGRRRVAINHPFGGGWITRSHGGDPLPWVQIEISRALYLDPGAAPGPRSPLASRVRLGDLRLAILHGIERAARVAAEMV